MWADGPRDEALDLAHRLYGEGCLIEEDGADSQALIHVIGTLSWCDDYPAGHTELMVVNPTALPWRSEAGLAAQRVGRYELARDLGMEEVLLADRFGAPRAIGVARRAAGLLERGEAAVELLRSAARILAACGALIELTRALLDRGTLRDALVMADRTGAAALGRQAREELRLAGGRPPAADTASHRLTASERRVADLAAAGHSNRQIADALFVTVKSVEWHLGNVYRKLDFAAAGSSPPRSARAPLR